MNDPSKIHLFSTDPSEKAKTVAFLKYVTKLGWEVTSVDEYGVHLKKPKKYGLGYFIVGLITCLILIGPLVWLIGLFDYHYSSDRRLFVPHDQITTDAIQERVLQ